MVEALRKKLRETRPPVKRSMIERTLRSRIISGRLAPGTALPSRHALCKTFGASIHTVQRAVDRLVEDRFVISRAGAGTYVAPTPPHLSQFALIFPHNRSDGYSVWSRFWEALSGEATRITRESDRRILPFYGVYGTTDAEDYQRLVESLRRQRLAGLIFASVPQWLEESPSFGANVPRVAIMSEPQFGVSAVTLDHHSFVRRAVDHLAARGRKRLGAIFTETGANLMADMVREHAQTRGMRVEPYWIQTAGLVDTKWAANAAHLMMNPNQRERPDALLIADDNLVAPATEGVRAAAVRVGDDLDVVAHCNFPLPPDAAVPVTRLGFDSRKILAECMRSIEIQRRGKQAPRETRVRAVFEDELTTA